MFRGTREFAGYKHDEPPKPWVLSTRRTSWAKAAKSAACSDTLAERVAIPASNVSWARANATAVRLGVDNPSNCGKFHSGKVGSECAGVWM